MPLGDRIKELRKQQGWSQDELAAKAGGDARGISRYENSHITPSLEALVRIAEALNVSLDHLAIDDIPRRPLHAPENILGDRLSGIAELDDTDLASLLNIIDALIANKRIRTAIDTPTG